MRHDKLSSMSKISQGIEKFGDLQVITVSSETKNSAVVLLHGYGADAQDLSPLSGMIKSDKKTAWYFPDGHDEHFRLTSRLSVEMNSP